MAHSDPFWTPDSKALPSKGPIKISKDRRVSICCYLSVHVGIMSVYVGTCRYHVSICRYMLVVRRYMSVFMGLGPRKGEPAKVSKDRRVGMCPYLSVSCWYHVGIMLVHIGPIYWEGGLKSERALFTTIVW